MNILVVHEVDYMRRVIYEYQTLPELLRLRGHNVYVIDYESLWVKDGKLISKTQELEVQRIYAPIKLYRPAFIKIPVLSRLSAFVTSYFLIERVLKEKKIDIVILYSVPTNGLQTIYLAHKYGVPVIFRSLDVLNQLVPRMLSGITKMMERKVYSSVDLTLAINSKMLEYVGCLGGKRVKVLPLGIDSQFKPNIDTSELRYNLGLEGKRVILFVGTLYNFSGLDRVIKNFHRVLKEFPEAVLLIVGDGIQHSKLDELIVDYGLRDKVFIMGYQKYETIPEWINLAEVCILPFEICKTTKDIIPTKVLQYLACGKPVVATKLAGLEGCEGILFTDDATEGIIELLKDNHDLGKRGLEYCNKHNYDNIVSQLEEILSGYLYHNLS